MAGIVFSNDEQIIQRVLPLLLKENKNQDDYIPKVASIGPYHHGRPELAPVEAFKPIAVDIFISGGPHGQNQKNYYKKVLESIGEIRRCYERGSTAAYSDADLARMMLRDACFTILYMETACPSLSAEPPPPRTKYKNFTMMKHLGALTLVTVQRDFFLLENQIPLSVIKLLINLRYEAGEDDKIIHRYLNAGIFGECREERIALPRELYSAEPLHLLEAFHRLVASDCVVQPEKTGCGWLCCFKKETEVDLEIGFDPTKGNSQGLIPGILKIFCCKNKLASNHNNDDQKKFVHSFRSVTDLKAKGIFVEASPTQSLLDVSFQSNFLYAKLRLPYWFVSIYTKVFFLNMVAYELSPNTPTRGEVASYIDFMKSLIERPEDVKELREKSILYNTLGSDREVLSVYKDINTDGADSLEFFNPVKDKIQAHYNSKTKTWMAELFHTYFRSPWTIIAFLAAISLLAISAAQLHYAVNPN